MNFNLRIRCIAILISIAFGLGMVACQGVSVPPPSQNNEMKQRNETSKNGVVSAANPDAAAIGVSILESGGNAIDAAVAVSFALGLVEPHASGPGGCGYALYVPHDGEAVFFDYRSLAPMALDAQTFMLLSDFERKNSIKAAGIPGAVAGWLALYEAYGSMQLAHLLEPTISLAEDGFKVTQTLAANMSEQFEKLSADEVCGELYLNNGLPYSEGDILKNPDYGKMLKLLSTLGKKAFYEGDIAQEIVFASEQKDGWFTADDLKAYEVLESEPIKASYRGYTLLTSAPSSSGGIGLAECLNILELYNLKDLGHNSAQALHLIAESLKFAHIDRYKYIGDILFEAMPVQALISKEYAKIRALEIGADSVQKNIRPGNAQMEQPSTTHISIVDKDGNMVAITNTLGTFFGCGTGVKGYGFLLDNQMYDFSVDTWEANFPKPGKRPRSSMCPTIILTAEGEPFAVLGTPGGEAIVSTMVQVVVNLIDYEMPVYEAISAPRIHQNYDSDLFAEGGIEQDVLESLEDLGHSITKRNALDAYFGGVHAIVSNSDNTFTGAADPRRDGKAIGCN